MTIQTIEIRGERFVIISEHDFLLLQSRTAEPRLMRAPNAPEAAPRFREITPLPVSGTPASEILIQDRQ